MKYRAVVITISDSCYNGEKEDVSGPALVRALRDGGVEIHAAEVIPDDRNTIEIVLRKYLAPAEPLLIVTTGGTGFGPRDVTPEATRAVIERPAPGVAELLRHAGASQTPMSWLSRGEAGITGNKFIVNLPGNPKAVQHSVETLRPILFHALDLLAGRNIQHSGTENTK